MDTNDLNNLKKNIKQNKICFIVLCIISLLLDAGAILAIVVAPTLANAIVMSFTYFVMSGVLDYRIYRVFVKNENSIF